MLRSTTAKIYARVEAAQKSHSTYRRRRRGRRTNLALPLVWYSSSPITNANPADLRQYIAIVNDVPVLEQRAGAISEARIDEVKIPLLLDAHSFLLLGQRQQRLWPATK
jgi:hypothetical protein